MRIFLKKTFPQANFIYKYDKTKSKKIWMKISVNASGKRTNKLSNVAFQRENFRVVPSNEFPWFSLTFLFYNENYSSSQLLKCYIKHKVWSGRHHSISNFREVMIEILRQLPQLSSDDVTCRVCKKRFICA